MSERATAFAQIQYGIESTPGTGTVNKKLMSIGVKPSPKIDGQRFTPQGKLFPTVIGIGKDYTEAKLDGELCYEELDFLLGSALAVGSTGTYAVDSDSPNTPQTYTIECGDSSRCEKFANAIVTGFNLKWSRDKIDFSGDMVGAQLAAASLTAGATAPASLTPIQAKDVTVTLAGSKLTRCFSAELDFKSHWKQLWALDAAQSSYVAHVEGAPDSTVKLRVEADADGMALLTTLRGGNAAQSLVIAATTTIGANTYSLTMTMYVKILGIEEFGDEEGVYAISYSLALVDDGTHSPISVTVALPE